MKKVVESAIIVILIIIISLMSVLLLSYNEYHVSQFGNKSLLISNNDMLNYDKGSLLVITSVGYDEIESGDYIFYCDTKLKSVTTVLSKVNKITSVDDGFVVSLTNGVEVESKYILGTVRSTKEYKHIGSILKVLESKKGNLFLIVIPSFLLFIYVVISMYFEYRGSKKIHIS